MANISPQTKAFALSGIMKDYKLSSLLSDALNSPVGSTKRRRASAALKALQKMKQNSEYNRGRAQVLDGQGGLGDGIPNPYIPTFSDQLSIDPLTGNVPGAQPLNFNTLQQSIQTLYPNQAVNIPVISSGWTGDTSRFKGSAMPAGTTVGSLAPSAPVSKYTPLNVGTKSTYDLFNSSNIIRVSGLTPTTTTNPQYTIIPLSAFATEPMVLNNNTNQPEHRFELKGGAWIDKAASSMGATGLFGLSNLPPRTAPKEATAPQQPQEPVTYPKEFNDYIASIAGKTTFDLSPSAAQQIYEQWQDMTGKKGIQPGALVPTVSPEVGPETGGLQPEVPPEIISWSQNWYNNLDEEDQQRFQTLWNSVNSGIGPEAFAYMVMSDRDELHRLFPGTPLDQLPMGGIFAEQMPALRKSIKDELGLTQTEAKLREVQSRGYTLLPTLTAYISGRDEYLHKIDGMIGDTKKKMINMDLSDPTLAKSMGDYMNYLYVLKGRQNKRYGDWLNQSIDTHNAEATRLNDQYTSLVNRYNEEVADQKEIGTARYEVWKGMLTGLYNSVDGMERKELETETLRAQLDATYLKMAIDAAGGKDSILDQAYLTDKDKYFDIIGGVKQEAVGPIGEDGKPTSIYSERAKDIDAMMDQAAAAGLDPEGVVYWLSNSYIPSYVKAAVGTGDLDETYDFYSDLIKNYASDSLRPTALEETSRLSNVLLNSAEEGLKQYTSNEDVRNSIQEVLRDLVDTTWRGRQKYDSPESREFFLEKNSGNLPDSILNKIFDIYEASVIRGGNNPLDLYNPSVLNDDLIDNLIKDISDILRAQLYSSP